jgi:hypothetical protein
MKRADARRHFRPLIAMARPSPERDELWFDRHPALFV